MTTEEHKQIVARLHSEKTKLEARINELRELTQPIAPDCAIGRVSRMDAINNRSINEAALRKSEEKLKMLNIALDDVDKPDFGKCRQCGKDIPLGRLMIMPGSPKCVACASMGGS